MNPVSRIVLLGCALLASACAHMNEPPSRPYLFGWGFVSPEVLPPRGGTTQGPAVELDPEPPQAWRALQADSLDLPERDRAAILAMAGDYRASFDFLETVRFDGATEPATPYRSWGTERIYVVESGPHFVRLQHILVMVVEGDDGELLGPFVQKHWRQDWRYEPERALRYQGLQRWRLERVNAGEARGRWSQTVYQVDDSPRYATLGSWEHGPQASVWTSEDGWRPLPRRESSVRDDYHVLEGRHRLTVMPSGWVHEQDNRKRVLDTESGRPLADRAREIGVNRYQRIRGFDFSAGDAYWEATGRFWSEVRAAWDARVGTGRPLQVAKRCEDEPAFLPFFRAADRVVNDGPAPRAEQRAEIERILDCLVTPG
ncbi:MAG: DUF6607 family protein [Myxococcota bacterium]